MDSLLLMHVFLDYQGRKPRMYVVYKPCNILEDVLIHAFIHAVWKSSGRYKSRIYFPKHVKSLGRELRIYIFKYMILS